ncbi:fibro-slime domain-containing protein [Pseudenhygromyxa sp. WMMC2535]|uniref:fibro-slime domain-containing protein n=1 Tax=Pseudenhygromyxa sp. WMMC2535 TaxID=2712867 RepID=UPI001557E308|nr:fibro-slime domain-containing protein [Pseudenhygromyxa sp. WMMC2535]NVB41025.1 fibro-slime domain-containing protein [Pseudenhygromyxa sp. WMMC2535]
MDSQSPSKRHAVPALTLALGLALSTACSGDEPETDEGISSLADVDEGDSASEEDESEDGDEASSTTGGIKLDIGSGLDMADGGSAETGEEDCGSTLIATVRDFQASHPDFETFSGVDPGIVAVDLGADDKPVYAGDPDTPTTTGKENFDQWYHDVEGVNQAFEIEIPLTDNMDGSYTYANSEFFPIDDQGFGNEFNTHNYHFTLELHGAFTYEGGEVFEFTGDDDLFTFVNGKLGIDLGGVHGELSGQIDMDAMAATLGIEVGETYSLDFFFAERHTSQSNFRIDTSIACFTIPEIG